MEKNDGTKEKNMWRSMQQEGSCRYLKGNPVSGQNITLTLKKLQASGLRKS
jgi:hypothetical protein